MAADNSMTNSAEIVAKAMIDEHADFLKDSAKLIAQELMEAEIWNSPAFDDTLIFLRKRKPKRR